MNKIMKAIIVTFFLTIVISACKPARPTQDPKVLSGKVIYQDDFSDPGTGWETMTTQQGRVGYNNGTYRMTLKVPSYLSIAKANKVFNDTIIDVDVTKAAGTDKSSFGVVCRATDDRNFYIFLINSAGYYGIGKVVDGNGPVMLGTDGPNMLKTSDTIKKGNVTNHLRVDCINNTLALYINGEKVSSVQDTELGNGNIGFVTRTETDSVADIRFDNLVVKNP
jgi:hypothetical protein